MPKMKQLFFTSPKWENIGGLIGYLLTLQDTGVPELQINGHKSILQLFDITRGFTHLDLINLNSNNGLEFCDEVMKIQYVILNRNDCASGTAATKRVRLNNETIPQDAVISYICKPHPKPGKLSPKRCVEIGVSPGPLFAKLKAGEEVTLGDGRVVKPTDVLGPSEISPTFIILECPSDDYLDSFLSADEFRPYQTGEDALQHELVSLIIHITPKQLYNSAKYRVFLNKFPSKTVHLVLCEENTYELSVAVYRTQYRLNLIHDEVFPLLPRSKDVGVAALTRYNIRPHEGLDCEAIIKIVPQEYLDEAKTAPDFDAVLSDLKDRLARVEINEQREYPVVTFLGTGSAIPSKDRNVSSILMAIKPNAYLLFDCGESTWSQIVRHYGVEEAKNVLRNLKCVYVSHMHADHHLGLITIIKERTNLGIETNLRIIGPTNLAVWLKKYSGVFESIDFDFSYCGNFRNDTEELPVSNFETFTDIGIDRISTCCVPHCRDAYGVRVDISGYSIVYSGDTRPASSLVELGQGCDLLIHEATMEDGLEEDALTKAHCTTSQAIEIGRQMNAKFTILTHFSQRYCKLPNVDEAIFEKGRVGCAFDHMQVSPKHLKMLPHIYPMLKCLFAEHFHRMTLRTSNVVKKAQQKEQQNLEEGIKAYETAQYASNIFQTV